MDDIKIARLEEELEVVKGERDKLKPSDSLYAEQKLAFTEDITAIRKQITALMTSRQGSANTQGNTIYYCATASIHDCKRSRGFRASMFKCAQECHALHSLEGLDKTIYFAEGSNDLTVSLLFRALHDAEDFQNKLMNFTFDHHHFASKLTVSPDILSVTVPAAQQLHRVMFTHYKSADNNESPTMSLNDMLSESTSVASNQCDASLSLQSLENPSLIIALHCKWYKCLLISKQEKEYANNPDNVIYASWLFHQQLDGLNTVDGKGVAIKFDYLGDLEEVQLGNGRYENRRKVNVIVEFRHSDVAMVFSALLKDGTVRLSDTEYRSFIYARDGAIMQYCLERKYQETVGFWRRSEGQDEDQNS